MGSTYWGSKLGEQVGESAGAMILCGAGPRTVHNGVAHIGLCWDGTKGNSEQV